MAIGLITPEQAANPADLGAERAVAVSGVDTPLLRFGLRQLFFFMAASSALLAAMVSSSGMTALVVLLAVTIVVMHVFATALGTRLQLRTEHERLRRQADQPKISDPEPEYQ